MKYEIDDGNDEEIKCTQEEFKKQLIAWSVENYFPQHRGYT